MIYLFMCLCELVFICWSYMFVKTYQLCAYKPNEFLNCVLSLNFSFGDKNRLNFTKRLIRLLITYLLISFGLFFIVFYFIHNILLILLDIILIFLFEPIILLVAHYITYPIEKLIKTFYIKKASRILKRKKIIKIGITGSYGKTSTKNILKNILEEKYSVLATPKNYNTEMGLSKTILEMLSDQQVFIAEMGARHKGDIKILADMVHPQYAIITTIGNQHLETFKTLKNIEDTKYELCEDEGRKIVFNGDSPSTRRLYDRFQGEKYLCNVENSYAFSKNEKMNKDGCSFDLILNKSQYRVCTKLFGKTNINNIVTASALAKVMGIDDEVIVSAIEKLQPIKHRLEVVENENCTIIDDSYNSNVVGAKEALEVLKCFDGEKIVVTPGFVELGSEQSKANFNLGCQIADVANHIIIMNDTNKNEILSGAISHNFERNNIHFADSRRKQKELLQMYVKKGSVVLFENDLPDNYQ